jgi:hypothetical protein
MSRFLAILNLFASLAMLLPSLPGVAYVGSVAALISLVAEFLGPRDNDSRL